MTLFDKTLTHVHAALGARVVLRGSLLTSLWVPGRGVNDIDVLVDGAWTPADPHARACEQALATLAGAGGVHGHLGRDRLSRRARHRARRWRGGAGRLRVGRAAGRRAGARPTCVGCSFRAVTAEVMFGWKVHSLVEHGPRGRWHAKTMADLFLLAPPRAARPGARRVARCSSSFDSQRMPLSALDGFFDDETWGRSRGSRNKWRSYAKKAPWVTFTSRRGAAGGAVRRLVRE
jgi:hypothetical protein